MLAESNVIAGTSLAGGIVLVGSDKLQVKLNNATATNAVQFMATYRELTVVASPLKRDIASVSGSAAVDLIGSPPASATRVVDFIVAFNNDTVDSIVTFQFTDGSSTITVFRGAIEPGGKITFTQGVGFERFNAAGSKMGIGDTGATATIAVGSTTTGLPGSNAAVSNSGSANNAILNFNIPRGDVGPTGAQGPSGTLTVGTVNTGLPGTSVIVTNSGTSSAATLNFTIPRGDVGATGATGATGPSGAAATIAVGTVGTGAPGSSAAVVNAGTSSAAVFNFTIPRGDVGATGATGPAGSAATIAVGTVTTGAAGSSVIVTNTGSSSAAVLNFTIPRGDTGAGVPTGGTTGQFLRKTSATDFATSFASIAISDVTNLTSTLNAKADLVGGVIPSNQLPSFVDDVIEAANFAALPGAGEAGKIYITLDTNRQYRWGGTVYVEITDTTAVWGNISGTLSSQTDLIAALNGKQASDATLTALAALDATAGLLEQTAADTFTKRAIGVGAASSILTRADGDSRYASISVTQYTDEQAQDAVAAALAAGTHTGITVTYNDAGNAISLASTITQYTDELAQDAAAAALNAGTHTGITVTYNDASNSISLASTITQYTDELAQDAAATALAAGTHTGITVTYNDASNSISLASTITQYTDELAQDAIAAAFSAGTHTGLTITYNDASNSFTFAVATQYTDEQAQDAVGAMIDASLEYVDATPLLRRAALTGAITASAGSNTTALGSFTKTQLNTAVSDGDVLYVGDVTQYTDELAQDALAAAFAAGTHTGLTITYNDASNSFSFAVTGSSYTDEQAQDAVNSMLTAGTHTGISFTYNDASNALSLTNTDRGTTAVSAHEAAADPHPQYLTATEGNAAYQPLDSDLTNISGLATTSYGRSQLTYADAAAATAALNAATSSINGLIAAADQSFLTAQRSGVFNVRATPYNAAGDGTADDASAINAAIAAAVAFNAGNAGGAGQRGAIVYFPPGIYRINSALTSPNADGIVFQGAGCGASTLLIGFAAGDVLSFVSGKSFIQVRSLQFFDAVARTSGAYINTNGANNILIQDVIMTGPFIGINVSGSSIKVTIQDYQINEIVPSTGVGIQITNGLAGDTYITGKGVMSNSAGTKPLAGVRIKQSGHFFIGGLNCTSTDQGLLIDPDANQDVSYGFITDCLFDSGTTNGMRINPANATTARVRSLKFVDTWFAGNANGAGVFITGQGASAVVDDIEFIGCRFLNNGTHGIQHAFGTNVRVMGGTIAGNSVLSSGVSDGVNVAAGVSRWMVTNCRIGPVGTATNTQRYAIAVAAGASNNFRITSNDLSGNVTGSILNQATAGGVWFIENNFGPVVAPGAAVQNQLLSAANTAVRCGNAIPVSSNIATVGTIIRITAFVSNAATASTNTITLRLGVNNTNADTAVLTLTLGAGTAAVGGAKIVAELCILTTGTTGTCVASIQNFNNGTTGFTNAVVLSSNTTAPVTINTTNNNFLGLYVSPSAANVVTIRAANAEIVSQ